jgi:hypothetical protein
MVVRAVWPSEAVNKEHEGTRTRSRPYTRNSRFRREQGGSWARVGRAIVQVRVGGGFTRSRAADRSSAAGANVVGSRTRGVCCGVVTRRHPLHEAPRLSCTPSGAVEVEACFSQQLLNGESFGSSQTQRAKLSAPAHPQNRYAISPGSSMLTRNQNPNNQWAVCRIVGPDPSPALLRSNPRL